MVVAVVDGVVAVVGVVETDDDEVGIEDVVEVDGTEFGTVVVVGVGVVVNVVVDDDVVTVDEEEVGDGLAVVPVTKCRTKKFDNFSVAKEAS